MLKSLSFDNLWNFYNIKDIEIKPITLILGCYEGINKNNSIISLIKFFNNIITNKIKIKDIKKNDLTDSYFEINNDEFPTIFKFGLNFDYNELYPIKIDITLEIDNVFSNKINNIKYHFDYDVIEYSRDSKDLTKFNMYFNNVSYGESIINFSGILPSHILDNKYQEFYNMYRYISNIDYTDINITRENNEFIFNNLSTDINLIKDPDLIYPINLHGDISDLIINKYNEINSRKFIIESNAEVLYLRFRRRIAERELNHNDVIIYIIYEDRNSYNIKPVKIDKYGDIDCWLDGLFSEDFKEVKYIRKAQRNLNL